MITNGLGGLTPAHPQRPGSPRSGPETGPQPRSWPLAHPASPPDRTSALVLAPGPWPRPGFLPRSLDAPWPRPGHWSLAPVSWPWPRSLALAPVSWPWPRSPGLAPGLRPSGPARPSGPVSCSRPGPGSPARLPARLPGRGSWPWRPGSPVAPGWDLPGRAFRGERVGHAAMRGGLAGSLGGWCGHWRVGGGRWGGVLCAICANWFDQVSPLSRDLNLTNVLNTLVEGGALVAHVCAT